MSNDTSVLMQELVDETYVLVKKAEEQHKKFSENYNDQLQSIRSQNAFLREKLDKQSEVEKNIQRSLAQLNFIVKIGYGGMIFGVVSFIIAVLIWLYAHKQFLDNQTYAALLANYRSQIPEVIGKDGKSYIRVVKTDIGYPFIDQSGKTLYGYYAEINTAGVDD